MKWLSVMLLFYCFGNPAWAQFELSQSQLAEVVQTVDQQCDKGKRENVTRKFLRGKGYLFAPDVLQQLVDYAQVHDFAKRTQDRLVLMEKEQKDREDVIIELLRNAAQPIKGFSVINKNEKRDNQLIKSRLPDKKVRKWFEIFGGRNGVQITYNRHPEIKELIGVNTL